MPLIPNAHTRLEEVRLGTTTLKSYLESSNTEEYNVHPMKRKISPTGIPKKNTYVYVQKRCVL